MSYVWFILFVVFLIKNSSLKNENLNLKTELYKLQLYIQKLQSNKKEIPFDELSSVDRIREEEQLLVDNNDTYQQKVLPIYKKEVAVISETISDKEKKNIIILLTGSLFVVLAAIVFLMSAWYSIPDILKTMVLVLLTLVFFGASYLAKQKLKLDKTSQAFFYIAMAYIPICLLSISIFGLLGEFLSIMGEGRYIYLTFCSLLVAFVYYYTYTKKENIYLLRGSILSQMFCIVLFSLIFANNILLIGVNLLLYNLLLIILTKNDIFNNIYSKMPFIIAIMSFYLMNQKDVLMIVLLLLLVINFLILEMRNSSKITSYMVNILLMVFGAHIVIVYAESFGMNMQLILMLIYVISLYVIESLLLYNTSRNNLKESLTLLTVLTVGVIHLASFNANVTLSPCIISSVQIVLLTYNYLKANENRKFLISILMVLYFVATGLSFIALMGWAYHAYVIFAIATFGIGELFRNKDDKLHSSSFVISHIFILLTYVFTFVFNFNVFINDILYSLLLLGIYVYCYLLEKKYIFKYAGYLAINYCLWSCVNLIFGESDLIFVIPLITTVVIMTFELLYTALRDELSDGYILLSQIISFCFIYSLNANIAPILAIICAIGLVLYNFRYKSVYWNIIPLFCVISAIFNNSFDSSISLATMIIFTAIVSLLSCYMKKISIFTLFSGIYLFLTLANLDNIYLREVLFALWSAGHVIFVVDDKHNDFFKFLLYISLLLIYNTVIYDLKLVGITALSMFGYIAMSILVLKTLLKKYIVDTSLIEYILFFLIYVFAFLGYADEADGIIFAGLILAIIFFSYMRGYGTLFIVSILSIIVNAFLLTRAFWFAVPWWVYLLVIGTVLIAFAVRNEISNKKEGLNIGKFIKSIANNLEEKKRKK